MAVRRPSKELHVRGNPSARDDDGRGDARDGICAARSADRVVFMADGSVVEAGAPDEFFTRPQNDRIKAFLSKILTH